MSWKRVDRQLKNWASTPIRPVRHRRISAAQVKIVEDLVAKGVDAIAVVPNDAKALEPVFKKARKKEFWF
jgi:simple sugar transport system substrate-binding protein